MPSGSDKTATTPVSRPISAETSLYIYIIVGASSGCCSRADLHSSSEQSLSSDCIWNPWELNPTYWTCRLLMVCKINEWDLSLKSAWFSGWPTLIASCLAIKSQELFPFAFGLRSSALFFFKKRHGHEGDCTCIGRQVLPAFIPSSFFWLFFVRELCLASALKRKITKKQTKQKTTKLSASHSTK